MRASKESAESAAGSENPADNPYDDPRATGAHGLIFAVFVVPADPVVRLVATFRCPVQPLILIPKDIQTARVGRVRVVHDAVLEHEGGHAGHFANVGRPVGAG